MAALHEIAEENRPGKEEGDFDIEQEKQNCDEEKVDREPLPWAGRGVEAAFVRRELHGVRAFFADQRGDGEERAAEDEAKSEKHRNGQVIRRHARFFADFAQLVNDFSGRILRIHLVDFVEISPGDFLAKTTS